MNQIWRHWLSSLSSGRRPVKRRAFTQAARIECLEQRTLLAAPVTVNGSATPGANRAFEGSVVTLALDADNDKLTFAAAGQPAHGAVKMDDKGTFTYTPNANYVGPDSFTFKANDGAADSNVSTFNLDVKPAAAPVATVGNATVSQNQPFAGTLAAFVTDANGDKLLFQAESQPAHGTLNLSSSGSFLYTPNKDYVGPDSFTFKANDGLADSNVAAFNLNVKTVVPPVAIDGSGSPVENVAFAGSVVMLAIDADGDKLTFAVIDKPIHGTLGLLAAGTFTYVPDANYEGSDSFTFRANDGAADSNVATFRLTVNPSVAPVAIDGSASPNENLKYAGTVVPLVTDANGQSLIFTVVTPPTHGKLNLAPAGTFTYTPDLNHVGPDSFTFKANDGLLDSNVATFNLDVRAVVPPVVTSASVNLDEDISFPGTLAPLASDADGGMLTFKVVSPPQHGSLSLSVNGSFTFTPDLNFNGLDSFTFLANDGVSDSNVGTFNLEFKPVNDPLKVILNASAVEVPRESGFVRIDSTATVLDVDTAINYANARLRFSIVSGSSRGVLAVLAETPGPTAVTIKGTRIYYGNSPDPIATVSGGRSGRALAINFNKAATEQSVNAVLKQISMRAGNDVVRGGRQFKYSITAGGQSATAIKLGNIV